MEKLHQDPSHLCKPEAFTDYNLVTPTPTTEKPLTEAEAKKLKTKIKRLQTTIDNLTPKEAKPVKIKFKAPLKETDSNMIKAIANSNAHAAQDGASEKMNV